MIYDKCTYAPNVCTDVIIIYCETRAEQLYNIMYYNTTLVGNVCMILRAQTATAAAAWSFAAAQYNRLDALLQYGSIDYYT